MAYVPPALRAGAEKPPPKTYGRRDPQKERLIAEKLAQDNRVSEVIKNCSESDFPNLSKIGETNSRISRISYSGKAESWMKTRQQDEINKKVEAELASVRSAREKQRSEEDAYLASQFVGSAKSLRVKHTEEVPIMEAAQIEPEWTLVQRKPRKEPKSKINFDEVSGEMSESSDQGDWDGDTADHDTLWRG